MRVYRLEPGEASKQYPLQKNGMFILVDPKIGAKKNTMPKEVYVSTEQEMIDLITTKNHCVRIETADPRGTIVRRNLYVDGKKVT